MGIVNLTDDSFSGDGLMSDISRAIERGMRMVAEGADILDIGAESSRPGASPIDVEHEIERIVPVVAGLRDCGVPLSIDTVKPMVMKQALVHGADMINDINALNEPGAIDVVAASEAAVCLMHMQGKPGTMQHAPLYGDVVQEVAAFLSLRVANAIAAGIGSDRIVIDPGFGFGKTIEHNLALLRELRKLSEMGFPMLVGLSRKSMLGTITDRVIDDRVHASVAAAMLAVARGANILRVHDVAATRDALAMWNAVENQPDDS